MNIVTHVAPGWPPRLTCPTIKEFRILRGKCHTNCACSTYNVPKETLSISARSKRKGTPAWTTAKDATESYDVRKESVPYDAC